MITSVHTRAALLLAASLFLLGGCERSQEEATPVEEQSAAPATGEIEPAPPPPPAQPAPPAEPPAGTMQEQTSPQGEGGMAQAPEQPQGATGGEGAATAPAAGGGDTETAMRNAGCFACHEVEQKKIGPAYSWVAHRYKDDANALETLVASIKNGSTGKWTAQTGGIPMPPNVQVPEDKIREMAQWILQVEPQAPPGG